MLWFTVSHLFTPYSLRAGLSCPDDYWGPEQNAVSTIVFMTRFSSALLLVSTAVATIWSIGLAAPVLRQKRVSFLVGNAMAILALVASASLSHKANIFAFVIDAVGYLFGIDAVLLWGVAELTGGALVPEELRRTD